MVLKTFRYLRARKLDHQLHQTDHYVAMAKVKILPIFRFFFYFFHTPTAGVHPPPWCPDHLLDPVRCLSSVDPGVSHPLTQYLLDTGAIYLLQGLSHSTQHPVISLLPAVSHTELLVDMEACAAYLSWVLLPQDRGSWTTAQAALGATYGRKGASYQIAVFENILDICYMFNFV